MNFQKHKAALVLFLTLQSIVGFSQISTTNQESLNQQGVTEAGARDVLNETGVTEDEIKQRLLQKGIDLDNLRPEQLSTVDLEIQQAIIELQAEKTSVPENGGIIENTSNDLVMPDEAPKEKDVEKEEPSEEELEEEERKKELKRKLDDSKDLFGFNIFFNQSVGYYEKVNSTSVPNSYVLDAGDKIAINIFGQSQADLLYEIEDDGFIRPSGMYKVYLRGVSLGKAKELLRKRFAQIYRFQTDQFNVSLNTARTVTVNIFGEVYNPGSYSVSALNNVINAIIVAGGPVNSANIRQIRVVSNGKERLVDIYDYITNPIAGTSLKLSDGDLIFLDKSNKQVSANGNGFRGETIRYELKENENLNSLIKYAGGVKNNVVLDMVQVETLEGEQRVLRDYGYEEAIKSNLKLMNGDAVAITSHYIKTENYFIVRGAVRKPGRYELNEGDKLATVLDKVVLEDETFSEVAYLTRVNDDGTFKLIKLDIKGLTDGRSDANINIESKDELIFYNKKFFTDTFQISITGAVREPGIYEVSKKETFTIYDLLLMSKGMQEFATDFGYVASVDLKNKNNTDYTIVNLKQAFSNPEGNENLVLKPGDKLIVPSQMDYTDDFEIKISGAIRNPGTFKYNSSLSLKEIVVMAGGFKLEAATNRIDIYRLQINENEPTVTLSQSITVDRDFQPLNLGADIKLEPFDHVVVRNAPEFEQIQYVTIKGEVRYPGVYALISNNEKISDIVARADGLTKEAFPEGGTMERTYEGVSGIVVTRLDKAIKQKSKHNLVIKSGDVITIPKTIDVVSIDRVGTNTVTELEVRTGERKDSSDQLNVQINYKPRRAKWYINKYGGGFSRDAKKSSTKVLYPNGQVKRTVNLGLIKIYPKVRRGSQIVLELKDKKRDMSDDERRQNTIARRERIDRIIDSSTAILTLSTSAITAIILSQKL
jgi:protein involved in polysaccharide export with SLBB domain